MSDYNKGMIAGMLMMFFYLASHLSGIPWYVALPFGTMIVLAVPMCEIYKDKVKP